MESHCQTWGALVPRRRQWQAFPKQDHTSTWNPDTVVFNRHETLHLWSKLAKPAAARRRYPPYKAKARSSSLQQGYFPLESAPPEILDIILFHTGLTRRDLVLLTISSDVLRAHVLSHIERECRNDAAPWAGQELACVGTFATRLPESFARDGLALASLKGLHGGPFPISSNGPFARQIMGDVHRQYKRSPEDPQVLWQAVLDHLGGFCACDHDEHLDPARVATIRQDILGTFADRWFCAPGTTWRLRNLTTRQYVRCVPSSNQDTPYWQGRVVQENAHAVEEEKQVRVDDVMIMYTSWDDQLATRGEANPHCWRGIWAGHCFDIVSQDVMDGDCEDWEDITDHVVLDAARLRGGGKEIRDWPKAPPTAESESGLQGF